MSEANHEMKHSNGQITNMLDNINENLDGLTELLNDIEKKLSSILLLEELKPISTSETLAPENPGRVPLAFDMSITNEKIIKEKQNLASLINRIEL